MRRLLNRVINENSKRYDFIKSEKEFVDLSEIDEIVLEETDFFNFLYDLSIEDLNVIYSAMYAGREKFGYKGTSISEVYNIFIKEVEILNKKEIVSTICSKSKLLNKYLETFIKEL